MITLNGKYNVPSQWEELTTKQYLFLFGLLNAYMRGELTVEKVRLAYLFEVTGIRPRAIRKKNLPLFYENIFRITRHLNFMFCYRYPKGSLDQVMPELREKLYKKLPEDLPYHLELEYVKTLDCVAYPDWEFARNLIPCIKIGRKKYPGYKFQLVNDIIQTNMTAGQYIDASLLCSQLEQTKDTDYVNMIIAILYCPGKYSSSAALDFYSKVSVMDTDTKYAAFMCFQAIQSFLAQQTKYGILWSSKQTRQEDKLTLGLSDSLYSLASSGYGSPDQVAAMPLTSFLDLLLKNMIDSVKTLKSMEMSKEDIIEKTGLSRFQVNKIY